MVQFVDESGSQWSYFGVSLESLRGDFGGTLVGVLWDHCGVSSGLLWGHFGIIVGSLWVSILCHFGIIS